MANGTTNGTVVLPEIAVTPNNLVPTNPAQPDLPQVWKEMPMSGPEHDPTKIDDQKEAEPNPESQREVQSELPASSQASAVKSDASRKLYSAAESAVCYAWNHLPNAHQALALGTWVLAIVGICAFITASKDAARQTEVVRECFTAIQRAFVTVTDVSIDTFHKQVPNMTGDLFWRFIPTIENSGTTPTKNMKWTTSEVVGGPIDDFNKLGLDIEALLKDNKNAWRYGILGPRAQMNFTYSADHLELHESWIPRLAANAVSHVWQGVIRYNDIFPNTEEHVTKFCYVIRVSNTGGTQTPFLQQCYGHKNCADDECKSD